MDLRCEFRKHGEIHNGHFEVKCRSKLCGAASGIVVIHRFDVTTGALIKTMRFRDPGEEMKD